MIDGMTAQQTDGQTDRHTHHNTLWSGMTKG